jgi:3',5'-cyclic AMP phosphodiesterase CpdA
MRVAAVADLHYSPQTYDKIREQMIRVRDDADVLVIAGDMTNYGRREEMDSLLTMLSRLRIPIVAVLGNHDFESG